MRSTTAVELAWQFREAVRLHDRGRTHLARALYRAILEVQPDHADALHLLGVVESQSGNPRAGIDLIGRSIAISPSHFAAHANLGTTLSMIEAFEEALACFDRSLQIRPDFVPALYNRGNTLLKLNRFAEGLVCCQRAAQLQPDCAPAWIAQGNALGALARRREALACYERALTLDPSAAGVMHNRGALLVSLGRHQEAARAFQALLSVAPDYPYARGNLFWSRLNCCDWAGYQDSAVGIARDNNAGARVATPFSFLSYSQSAMAQRRIAQEFVADNYPMATRALWNGERYSHGRIRVAYLSADFQDHATAYLAAGLFECHDRERFEITAISFGWDDKGGMRARLKRAFDRFIDARTMSDLAAARLIREAEIDIAVFMQGLTAEGRLGILAHRPAPIQVNYLAHPGTTGADYIDYVLADRHVIPESHHPYYTEKVVYLPDCYQINDAKRTIAAATPCRSELGLPQNAFVFCCFNQSYKISPDVFECWMRLLERIPGSVLWLYQAETAAAYNLRNVAVACGVAAERLIFAPWMQQDRHLARYRLADLFLDTAPYNAHTTASDALWTGLPVLTCHGTTFAGRVGASLLNAVGLGELITNSLEEYESLAFRLATDPDRLAAIRARLSNNRTAHPLFDTTRTCHGIESAYTEMWRRYQQGKPPSSFAVLLTTTTLRAD